MIPWSLLIGGTGGALVLLALNASLRGMCRSPWEAISLVGKIMSAVVQTLVQYVERGFRPEYPKWTLQFELLRAVMQTCTDFRRYRRRIDPVRVNGLEHLWIRSLTSRKSDTKRLVIMYVHGGAFALLSPRFYSFFGATLAAAVDKELSSCGSNAQVDIFMANYHKAPEYCFPTQPKDVVAAYEYLLDHEDLSTDRIILAGDSAGGGLVMSTLLRLRDSNLSHHLPLAAIVSSPFVDFSESIDPKCALKCILTRRIAKACRVAYHPHCADRTTWVDASAVHCNLKGLPPMLIQAATLDYLYQDSERLAAKAKADGVRDWEFDLHHGVSHVFSLFPSMILPYAEVGMQKMAAFAAKQFIKT
ncbi:hypothetical protein BBO99_00007400 [Phytophthora kernoviae]|uniref:Alpha/beta hydrolase fold-3 domain-containing protein n=2 Tax=Phytophthora kernoviae TaxID=325452 RepID=A0A421EX76_9STRA|nr:hypothetical protein JM18_008187 [Phytophthora kernoviae]RLN06821.1 hypothetical protein BBI17_007345 [Phytophthora kernoviae]RLN76620.1 hypothetical protein BBO99_00007400 [Phytophthora kernoviae]